MERASGIGPRSKAAISWMLLPLILCTLLYAPFLGHPFQYDDGHTIVQNAALTQPGALLAMLTGSMASSGELSASHYRPATYLSYWLTIHIFGLTPTAFHAVNLALHLIAGCLLFAVVAHVVGDHRVGVAAATVLLLHPAASESVLYASARAGLLASAFLLAAIACYLRARHQQVAERSSAGWWMAFGATGAAALLSKESAVVLPLLCLAADRVVLPKRASVSNWQRWIPVGASCGMALALVVGLGLWRHVLAALAKPHALVEYLRVVMNQFEAIGLAIRLFVVPWPLTVDHPLPEWPEPAAVSLTLLACGWTTVALFALASRHVAWRRVGFFALWVILVALPTVLWPLNVPFQEHRAYLQHAALSALIAMGAVRLADAGVLRRPVLVLAGLGAALAAGWLIVAQGRLWSDPVRLWTHAREASPASFRAHTNAGLALAAAGRWDEADHALASALALRPEYPPALVARGVIEHRRGALEAARSAYQRAVDYRSDYVPALYNLGLLAQQSNDPVTAETWYRRALAVNPHHADSLLNLGVLMLATRKLEEAGEVFARARAASPPSAELWYYSGVLAERRGQTANARAYYREARDAARASGRETLAADAQARMAALDVNHGGESPGDAR